MKKLNILLLSILSLGLASCASPSADNSNSGSYKPRPANKDVVMSDKWQLNEINNSLYQGPRISLELSDQNRISGFSGCNRYFASVSKFSDGVIKIDRIGSTKKACADGVRNRLERNYLNALGNVTRYQRGRSRMVLEGNGSTLVFLKKTKRR